MRALGLVILFGAMLCVQLATGYPAPYNPQLMGNVHDCTELCILHPIDALITNI